MQAVSGVAFGQLSAAAIGLATSLNAGVRCLLGAFVGIDYAHVLVSGVAQMELTRWFQGANRDAVVSPTVNAFTLVSERGRNRFSECVPLAEEISSSFHQPALAIAVFDDDVLLYKLFTDGSLIDEYNSCPDYEDFRGEHVPPRGPMGGNASLLARIFRGREIEGVESVLRKDLVFETECDRHLELARLLGWPSFVVSFDYDNMGGQKHPKGDDRPLAWSLT